MGGVMSSRIGLLLFRPIFILASFLGVVLWVMSLGWRVWVIGIVGPIRREIISVGVACARFDGEMGIVVFVSERCGASPEDYQSLTSGHTIVSTLTVIYSVVLFLLLSESFLLVAAEYFTITRSVSSVFLLLTLTLMGLPLYIFLAGRQWYSSFFTLFMDVPAIKTCVNGNDSLSLCFLNPLRWQFTATYSLYIATVLSSHWARAFWKDITYLS